VHTHTDVQIEWMVTIATVATIPFMVHDAHFRQINDGNNDDKYMTIVT